MNAVWKFPLELNDVQTIDAPARSQPLSVQVQGGAVPCLWMLVNPENPTGHFTVRIAGTGHPREDLHLEEYVDTFQIPSVGLVFHAFVSPS